MNREQRYRYEMFVRVRDYGTAHSELFPASSTAGQMFGQVSAVVAAIDEHLKHRALARTEARKVKAAARAAVFEQVKTLAFVARRFTAPGAESNPFRIPRRLNLKVEITTARSFIDEAEKRQEQFLRFGLPRTFLSDMTSLVDDLQRAIDVRISSKTSRWEAQAGIQSLLMSGLDRIRDLDVMVTVATRQDAARLAAWRAARRIEGQGTSPSSTVKTPASVSASRATATAGEAPAAERATIDPVVALGKVS